jgi:hypothetical protein
MPCILCSYWLALYLWRFIGENKLQLQLQLLNYTKSEKGTALAAQTNTFRGVPKKPFRWQFLSPQQGKLACLDQVFSIFERVNLLSLFYLYFAPPNCRIIPYVSTDERYTSIKFPLPENYAALLRNLSPMFCSHFKGSDMPSRNVHNHLPANAA